MYNLMSFLSILKKVGGVAENVAQVAAPIVTTLNPVAGAALNGLLHLVTTAEQLHPAVVTVENGVTTTTQTGPSKKQWVMDSISSVGLPLITAIFDAKGEVLKIDSAALSAAIDDTVALLNDLEKVKASFSLTPKK